MMANLIQKSETINALVKIALSCIAGDVNAKATEDDDTVKGDIILKDKSNTYGRVIYKVRQNVLCGSFAGDYERSAEGYEAGFEIESAEVELYDAYGDWLEHMTAEVNEALSNQFGEEI